MSRVRSGDHAQGQSSHSDRVGGERDGRKPRARGTDSRGSPNGFEVVDVTTGGPAEEAGFKAGDTILDVDGRSVSEIHCYDLRERLRNDPPGTVVTFRVKSGSEARALTVTLRDLI